MTDTPSAPPLTEADPTSLDALFSLDPFKMTRRNRDEIVSELRRMRENYVRAEAAGVKVPKAEKVTAPQPKVSAEDLEL